MLCWNPGITVSLTAPNYSVNESSRFLQVCAHITVGMVKREIEMLLRSEPGSAQGMTVNNGENYLTMTLCYRVK